MIEGIPPVPQTGRLRLSLSAIEEDNLLQNSVKNEQFDIFVSDPDPEISHIGRLALRREEIYPGDYLELADRCAQLSLDHDRLDIAYVQKTLEGYTRAGLVNETMLDDCRFAYLDWLMEVAQLLPGRNNIAVALWAAAQQNFLTFEMQEKALLTAWEQNAYFSSLPVQTSQESIPPEHEEIIEDLDILVPGVQAILHPDAADTQAGEEVAIEGALSIFDAEAWDSVDTRGGESVVAELRLLEEQDVLAVNLLSPAVPLNAAEDDEGFRVGDTIGSRYKVRQILKGGMGLVYMCYDDELHLPVTLKTFQNRFLLNEKAVARFTQEALTWIRLEKHQYIVQALRVQKFNSRPHIILESIVGPEGLGSDLRSWIDHRRLNLETTLRFALQIALGMQHATARVPGLVHRDLKPANILVRHDGVAKITDFGLVRSVDVPDSENFDLDSSDSGEVSGGEDGVLRLTRAGAIIGTAPYMSPEQAKANDVDLRSDIYAFGCVMFEMLTWSPLFKAKTLAEWVKAHSEETPEFPSEMPFDVPPGVRAFVLMCVAKIPEYRPRNWDEIVEALTDLYETHIQQPPSLEWTGSTLEVDDLMNKAYSLAEIGYTDEALEAYDRALHLEPGNPWTIARKARTLRLLGRYEEALTCVNRALELNPRFGWAWLVKGQIQERQGKLESALASHETAADIMPDDVWVWYNQASVLFSLGQHQNSLKMLDKALEVDPRQESVWAKRGQVLRALERHLEALNAYNRALELSTAYAWAWNG
ncbi:MAG TPA: serine/threonine-protein kinase, partial [Aggregatilineales bacterium]|nr:serine/threonine-protein kinase [Aggregatilineales bacterium]